MAKISINIKSGTIKQDEWVVGIDLGTTNSLVAMADGENREVKVLGAKGEVIVPSVVYFAEDGAVVVGEEAKKALVVKPESTIFSVKRLLGKSFNDIQDHADFLTYRIVETDKEQMIQVEVGGKYYSPVQLSAYILTELKRKAEQYTGKSIDKAVITVPAYFNDAQRQATRDAGKLAGIDVMRIVNEPTAASLAYGLGLDKSKAHTIAVYDLGGGTFDISILRIEDGVFEVLSTHGNTYLGGDDFDRAIVQYWVNEGVLTMPTTKEGIQAVRLAAEQLKRELSYVKEEVTSSFSIENKPLELKLTKAAFENCIKPYIDQTLSSCEQAVNDAGISVNEIDELVFVGGSTRIPFIKEQVKAYFEGVRANDTIDPDQVVALGAAVEADILAGNRKDLLLLDVTPLSLGIETLGGLMDVIIPRNSKVPTKASRQYTTSIDGQVNIGISVYQGEREMVADNRKLAEFQLMGIPSMPAGLPKVEIGFLLDADGVLKVEAKELRSGIVQEIKVKPTYGLTDAEVEAMLVESLKNAQNDIEARMLVEAQTEAHQMVYTADRFLERNATSLTKEEVLQTQKLIEQLKSVANGQNKDEILQAIDTLNQYTQPFAERVMDHAIGQALQGKKIDF